MTAAIMQPYLFPYLGYYQLVNAVDTFVFFDDVNFINKGWINRNNILQQNQPLRFTIPLLKASQNKLINEIEIADYSRWRNDFLKTLEMCYRKAPHFTLIYGWMTEFFSKDYLRISHIAEESISCIASLLQLSTKFQQTSLITYKAVSEQDGQMKVLELCRLLGVDTYINPKDGVELYDKNVFTESNIELRFINMNAHGYKQFKADSFVPNLSIIDVLMFNGIDGTKELLTKYSLN